MDGVLNRRRGAGEEKREHAPLTAAQRWRRFRHLSYIYSRRFAYAVHGMAFDRRTVGPVSFLAVAAALGLALTLNTLYTPSYTVSVGGEELGVVQDQRVVTNAIAQVERRGTQLLGYPYHIDSTVDYQFALTLKTELDDQSTIENFFYRQLDQASVELRKYQVSINGAPVGEVTDREALDELLEEIKNQYVNENTISAEFLDNVGIESVYTANTLRTIDEMRGVLTANKTGETTYTVVAGDTFSGIAYANDMSISDLKALNPDMDINRLMIGDVLNVKQIIPLLSVTTVDDVTYNEEVPCPVETVDDSSMYIGDSKIISEGTPGEAEVNAHITYVNGYETQREVLSSTTLREPTVTTKAVGTKEKPRTASTGTYAWPTASHHINSYFGGRYIFGGYSYHSGLDIRASYGSTISAADGGTVTFAGSKGTYGNLVIITHDNGVQTYYAHNSSLLVSVGQKVYKGQAIARAGSTGRSTAPHCHFEIRVNGTAVNPLSYLR